MTKDSIRQIAVIAATITLLVVQVLADIIPINGTTTNQVSAQFNVYFVPADYAFSIWSLIYFGLVVYSIFQALPAQKMNPILRKIGWWYVGGSLALASWVIFFHYRLFVFSMLMMIALLVSLIIIYEHLHGNPESEALKMRLFVHTPFSIFIGWITMATIANVSGFLHINGWNGLGISPRIWAVVMIFLAIVIAELTAFNRQDLAYLAVFVWAFIAIAVKHYGVSPVFEAASVAAVVVIIITMVTVFVKPKIRRREK